MAESLSVEHEEGTGAIAMKAYDELWGVAEDNYGIVTSAQARELGVSRQNLAAMERGGLLTRLCHGVYQIKHHVPGANDVFAAGVAMAGETAYLRGASVIAMLGLAPTDPGRVFVGAGKRVRRRLPAGFALKDRTPCDAVEFDGFEGIRCQPLAAALRTARDEGAIEADRIADAAAKAREQGLLSDEESAQFQD
jgi:hypothetical protein